MISNALFENEKHHKFLLLRLTKSALRTGIHQIIYQSIPKVPISLGKTPEIKFLGIFNFSSEPLQGNTLFVSIAEKFQNLVECKVASLRSRLTSGITQMIVMLTCVIHHAGSTSEIILHVGISVIHTVTARKEISIKFSSMEKYGKKL